MELREILMNNNYQFIISSQLISKLEIYFLSFKSSYSGHCLLSSIVIENNYYLNLYQSWTHTKNNDYCLHTYNDLKLYSGKSELLMTVKFISTEGFLSNRFPNKNSDKIINLDKLKSDKTYNSFFTKILNITPPSVIVNNSLSCNSLKKICSFLQNPKVIDSFTEI